MTLTPGETVAAAFGFVACLPFIVALNWAGARLKRGRRMHLPARRPAARHRTPTPIRHSVRASLADRVDLSRVPDPRPPLTRAAQSVVARLPRQLRRSPEQEAAR